MSSLSRRSFLAGGIASLCALAGMPGAALASDDVPLEPRRLWLHRQDTGETVLETYREGDIVDAVAYRQLCWLLRDVAVDAQTEMDLRLLDILSALQDWLAESGLRRPFNVTSAYRTPETNSRIEGAAHASLHLHGKAVDVWMPDVPVDFLGKLGLALADGGVGFYPTRGFVHLDSGDARSWWGGIVRRRARVSAAAARPRKRRR